MRFEYSGWIGLSSDTGEAIAYFRPVVRIQVYGPDGVGTYDALVDTGADTCLFPRTVAADLGIEDREAEGPDATTATGDLVASTFADAVVELSDGDRQYKWPLRVYFQETAEDTDQLLILGHLGFLEFFIATFIGEQFALELEANEYLPHIT